MSTQTADKHSRTIQKLTRAGVLLLGLLCLIVLLLVLRFSTKQISVKAGDKFSSDISAPFTGTDSFLTDKARQKARESAPVVYETSAALVKEYETAAENWFAGLEGWFADMAAVWEQDTEILENKYRFRGLDASWKELVPENKMAEALKRRGLSEEISVTVAYLILDKYMPANTAHTIGEKVTASDFKAAFTEAVYPLLEEGVAEKDLAKRQTTAKNNIKKKSLLSSLKTEVAGKLTDRFLLPTVTVDEAATEENRRLAAATVGDVRITRGETLFKKGAVVTAEDITHLTSLGLLKGAGAGAAFSFPALAVYAFMCVLASWLWILVFDKRTLLRTGAMYSLTLTYAAAALLAFAFSYFKAEAAPVLFAVLSASEEGRKEHTAGALIFSILVLPVILDTDMPFGAASFTTGASLSIGGLCVCAACHLSKGSKAGILSAGLLGGTAIGVVRLCPLLWENVSGLRLAGEFGIPFLSGLLAAVLAVLFRPVAARLNGGNAD